MMLFGLKKFPGFLSYPNKPPKRKMVACMSVLLVKSCSTSLRGEGMVSVSSVTTPLVLGYTEVELTNTTLRSADCSIALIKRWKPFLFLDGMLITRTSDSKNVAKPLFSWSMSMIKGVMPFDSKSLNLLGEVVEPYTWCPSLISFLAKGIPSQPHPSMLIFWFNLKSHQQSMVWYGKNQNEVYFHQPMSLLLD